MRTFLGSLGISLCVLILVLGLVTVDYRGRKMSFGEDEPPLAVSESVDEKAMLNIRLFGVKKAVDITEIYKIWNLICDFSCIPHQ